MKSQEIQVTGESITPAVHLEFIQNQAGLPSANGGVEEIESYHRSLFLHHHARDLERFQQQRRVHEDRLVHLEARLKNNLARLNGVETLVPVKVDGEPDIHPTTPWNFWDRTMFVASLLGIICLLVFGVLNISFNLLESGLVTFVENPIRAYFWGALLPAGALAVKIGWDFIRLPQRRDLYFWSCLILGALGILVWIGAYAAVYPSLSKTTAEHIQTLSVFGDTLPSSTLTPNGAKWIDAMTVAAQAVAEVFLSAALGIYMTIIYGKHRPVRLMANPVFRQFDEERKTLETSVESERLALAEACGNQTRLEHQLSALVAYAKSMFQKEAALRMDQSQQKQRLWDQISEQLRSQFPPGENSHNGVVPHKLETSTANRANGK